MAWLPTHPDQRLLKCENTAAGVIVLWKQGVYALLDDGVIVL
jgi:hypothetical protein